MKEEQTTKGMREKFDAHYFAEMFPEENCWRGYLDGENSQLLVTKIQEESRKYEAHRARILEVLPELTQKVDEILPRLEEIHEDVSRGPRRQSYNPLRYFSQDERSALASSLEILGMFDHGIQKPGLIRLKKDEVCLHPSSRNKRDLRNKWGKRISAALVPSGFLGSLSGTVISIQYELPEFVSSVSMLGAWPLAISGGFLGDYLGEKYGAKLGGRIPLKDFYKDPFRKVAQEVPAGIKYIQEKLG